MVAAAALAREHAETHGARAPQPVGQVRVGPELVLAQAARDAAVEDRVEQLALALEAHRHDLERAVREHEARLRRGRAMQRREARLVAVHVAADVVEHQPDADDVGVERADAPEAQQRLVRAVAIHAEVRRFPVGLERLELRLPARVPRDLGAEGEGVAEGDDAQHSSGARARILARAARGERVERARVCFGRRGQLDPAELRIEGRRRAAHFAVEGRASPAHLGPLLGVERGPVRRQRMGAELAAAQQPGPDDEVEQRQHREREGHRSRGAGEAGVLRAHGAGDVRRSARAAPD